MCNHIYSFLLNLQLEGGQLHFSECAPDPCDVVHGRLNAACVDVISIIGAISMTRTTATPFSTTTAGTTVARCAVVVRAPATGEITCSIKRTQSMSGRAGERAPIVGPIGSIRLHKLKYVIRNETT